MNGTEEDHDHLSPQLNDALQFALSKPDPLNTVLCQADGDPLSFRIATPSKLFQNDVTTITRERAGEQRVIGTIRWHHYEPDRIELDIGGATVRLLDYFPRDGEFYRWTRRFSVKEQSFRWRWMSKDSHFELSDSNDILLARDHRRKVGLFVPDFVPVSLEVAPTALDILDDLIVTYICIAQEMRQAAAGRRDPTAAATVMSFK